MTTTKKATKEMIIWIYNNNTVWRINYDFENYKDDYKYMIESVNRERAEFEGVLYAYYMSGFISLDEKSDFMKQCDNFIECMKDQYFNR